MLNEHEKKDLRFQQKIERAVSLFLDLETDRTLTQIATEMNLSINALKDLTRLPEFMDAWNQHFMDLGHDPRLKATQAALVDMVPAAVRQLKVLIVDTDTPAPTRLAAIKELFRMVGVDAPKNTNERNELAEFLKNHDVTLNQININPPQKPKTRTVDAEASPALTGSSAPIFDVEPSEPEDQGYD